MKKLSLFTLLLTCWCFIQAQTHTITISGQVRDLSNVPVPNYPVDVVIDSSFFGFFYFNTVLTDVNGNYSDAVAVPLSITTGSGYTGTRDCNPNGYPMNTFTFTNSTSAVSNLDFSICVPVGGGCNSSFTGNWVLGTTMVNFTDYSTATSSTITSWAWDFGDGSTSTLQNPSHVYNTLGAYTVCLTIGSASGCTSTWCDSLVIGGSGINCQAALSASTTPGGATLFTTTASGTGSIASYYYDFGDGVVLNSANANESHTYATNGTYNACVWVYFSDSCVATACTSVTISTALGCQAGYYWFPDSSGQFSIIVVNTSSGVQGATYLWTFGDGTSSTQAYPSHQYSGPGTYVVCVTISTQNPSCTDTYCDSIMVVNKVAAPFSINVVADGTTAVAPTQEAASVHIYPNPAHDFFQVNMVLDQMENVSISLMDLSGRVIALENAGELQAGKNEVRLNTSNLPAGVYMARVQAGATTTTHRVMIAR